MKIRPIQKKNRIIYLDILRGMAILFIFIANIYHFAGWNFTPDEVKQSFTGYQLNRFIKHFTSIFIDGKWYSIFSILFGIGFAIQYENAKKSGKSFPAFFSIRMLGLLLFGLIHLFFIWLGDILALYALLGFVLIYFRNHSNRSLLIWAGILLVLPVVHLLLMVALDFFYPQQLYAIFISNLTTAGIPLEFADGQFDFNAFILSWIGGDSWRQLLIINLNAPLVRLADLLFEGRLFKVLACFLIGVWSGRQILHHHLLENNTFLRKIVLYGMIIGLPFNLLLAYGKMQPVEAWGLINSISYALGVVPLACAYAAIVALIVHAKPTFLKHFAPVGQMAMSNYIFQSLISIFIFYGVGLGYAFQLALWQIMLILIIIFIGQIIFSTLWLRTFRFGPLEWIWRMMTYRKYIPLRKKLLTEMK